MTQNEVFDLIQGERSYQKKLWPSHKHSYREYVIYIRDYLTEALHLESRFTADDSQTKAIVRKIAAMCSAATEENSPAYMTGAYLSVDAPGGVSQPFVIWLADMARIAESSFLGILNEHGFKWASDSAIHAIYAMAFHCMEEHGAPARDIEGDLAKRRRQPPPEVNWTAPKGFCVYDSDVDQDKG